MLPQIIESKLSELQNIFILHKIKCVYIFGSVLTEKLIFNL